MISLGHVIDPAWFCLSLAGAAHWHQDLPADCHPDGVCGPPTPQEHGGHHQARADGREPEGERDRRSAV